MKPHTSTPVEEIAAEEIEILGKKEENTQPIYTVSADDPLPHNNPEHHLGKLFENIEELKKIRFFGPLALLLSFVGIVVYPFFLQPSAIALAILDLYKGSKFTRKISIVAIVIGTLGLLNAWN